MKKFSAIELAEESVGSPSKIKVSLYEETSESERESKSRKRLFLGLFGLLLAVVVVYRLFGQKVFSWLTTTLVSAIRKKSMGTLLTLLAIQVVFGWVLFLPGLAYFNIIQAMIMRDVVTSWMISFFGAYLTGLSVHLVVNQYSHALKEESIKQREERQKNEKGFIYYPSASGFKRSCELFVDYTSLI